MPGFTHCHDILVLNLYFEAGRVPLPQDDERVFRLSKEIPHSQKSIHLKMANFQWFDPKRIGGLDGGSRQTWEIWHEFTSSGVNPPLPAYNRFSRCDDILVLGMYFEAERQPLSERDPRVIELSGIVHHSPKSIHRRMAAYQWLDPDPKRIGGIDSASKQAKGIWDEFAHDKRRLQEAAADCRNDAELKIPRKPEPNYPPMDEQRLNRLKEAAADCRRRATRQ